MPIDMLIMTSINDVIVLFRNEKYEKIKAKPKAIKLKQSKMKEKN